MTNKTTKRALLASIVSLVLCFSMLLGTTYAWFTDSESTGINTIIAGNLDVELEYATWDSATGTWTEYAPVLENKSVFNENALWEPGYTEVVKFRVTNVGTLALKYQFGMDVYSETGSTNIDNAPFKLSESILVGSTDVASVTDRNAAAKYATKNIHNAKMLNVVNVLGTEIPANVLYPKNSPEGQANAGNYCSEWVFVVHMPVTVGNEANHKTGVKAPEITFGVNLVATQNTIETDSFNNQYDKDAAFPDPVSNGDDDSVTYAIPEGTDYTTVSNSDELKTALQNNVAVILLKDGEYNWSGTGHNGTSQTVSIYGESKNAILKVTNEGGEGGDNDFDGYTVTFNSLTITSDNNWSTGWKRMNATFNDCVINNNLNLVNGNHVFNYCTLNQSENEYNIWTYGASNAEFNYCTFNCAGKSIYVDGNGSNKTVLKVNNCIFNDNGGVENKAAIETGTTYGTTYDLIVNNTAVNGFAVNPDGTSTGSTLWANKHSMVTDKLNVVVDGDDVY